MKLFFKKNAEVAAVITFAALFFAVVIAVHLYSRNISANATEAAEAAAKAAQAESRNAINFYTTGNYDAARKAAAEAKLQSEISESARHRSMNPWPRTSILDAKVINRAAIASTEAPKAAKFADEATKEKL